MHIAIVSRPGPVLNAYERFFAAYDVDLIHARTVAELYQKLAETVISGFVIEIQMMVKATDTEKELLHTMAEIFPSAKTNWHPEQGFRALYNDSEKSGEENLRAFIRDCGNFKPRALRRKKRHEKKFNVLFWPLDAPQEQAQKAFTLDVSTDGLFVGTCDPPPEGSLIWVVLRELDARPFRVMVKWKLPWGKAMRVPGFGGSFQDLDAERTERLEAMLAERNHKNG